MTTRRSGAYVAGMAAPDDRARKLRAAVVAALGLLSVLAAAGVADVAYFSRGYSATWYQYVDPRSVAEARAEETQALDTVAPDRATADAGVDAGVDGGARLGAHVGTALAADLRPRGLSAPDKPEPTPRERVVIDRTTEHRVRFANVHRPLSRYLQGWPVREHPIPRDLPSIDVTLRASIEIPEPMPLRLGTRVRRDAAIWADGEPLGDRRLAPGRHDLWIHWTAKPRPYPRTGRVADGAFFQLVWGSSSDPDHPVPASALSPADGGGASRTVLWLLALLLGPLLGLGLYRVLLAPRVEVRRDRLAVVLTAVVVLLGLGFRGYDYDVMPEFRENVDELFATWNGWSLLEDGTPRGWSIWTSAYRGRARMETAEFFGESRPVITPYFEHPPLLHVLVGAAAHLGGAQHYLEAKLKHTRLVPIGLMAIGTVLMIAIGRRLWPTSMSPYLGAAFFSVLPNITMQTRVIKEEALLVPLILGTVLFFLRWRDDGRRRHDLVLAAVCAGAATLAKVPAGSFIIGLAMLVAAEPKAFKDAMKVVVIGAAVGSLLLLYGAVIDWNNFVFAQSLQSHRAIHWNIFTGLFHETQINGNRTGQGWFLYLWFGYAAMLYSRGLRESAPLTVVPLVYFVAIAVGTGNWAYGWYIVPLYPFLCLGAGEFLAMTWRKPTLWGGLLLIGLLTFYSLNFFLDPTYARAASSWPFLRAMITLTTALALAPFAAAQVWHKRPAVVRLARAAIVVALAVTVVGSANFVVHYDRIYETHDDFDVDPWFTP